MVDKQCLFYQGREEVEKEASVFETQRDFVTCKFRLKKKLTMKN